MPADNDFLKPTAHPRHQSGKHLTERLDGLDWADPVVGIALLARSSEVGPALHGSDWELNRALEACARRRRRELGAHHWLISDYASGLGATWVERLSRQSD
jgi:hypothetical protein